MTSTFQHANKFKVSLKYCKRCVQCTCLPSENLRMPMTTWMYRYSLFSADIPRTVIRISSRKLIWIQLIGEWEEDLHGLWKNKTKKTETKQKKKPVVSNLDSKRHWSMSSFWVWGQNFCSLATRLLPTMPQPNFYRTSSGLVKDILGNAIYFCQL